MAIGTYVSRFGTMAREVGITRTFEYFLNERNVDTTSLTYLERCKLVIAFVGEMYAQQDQYVTISNNMFHIKPIPGEKPLWKCCIAFRDGVTDADWEKYLRIRQQIVASRQELSPEMVHQYLAQQ